MAGKSPWDLTDLPACRDLFCERVRLETSGCWTWMGPLIRMPRPGVAYGKLTVHQKTWPAHRFAYRIFREAVPRGLDCDHLCRNTRCVNPWHLEPVTRRENLMRGDTLARAHAERRDCGFAACPGCRRFRRGRAA